MNLCAFTGRLTHSPELKSTASGKNVCNFTLAVERRFKDADGKPVVDFIEFVAWENNATFLCKWFDKGVRVAVTGELQTRMYEKDGKKIKVSEVLVNTVEFADGKVVANASVVTNNAPKAQAQSDDDFLPVGDDEGLPWS